MIEELVACAPDLELHVFAGEPMQISGCVMHLARGANTFSDATRFIRDTAREIEQLRPAVFWSVTHSVPLGIGSGLPRILTVNDVVWRDCPETMSRGKRLASFWLQRAIPTADAIVCISRFTRDRAAQHWPELASRLVVVPCAANPALQRPPDGPDHTRRARYLVNVDTIEPRKNLTVLFEAMGQLDALRLIQCGKVGWRADAIVAAGQQQTNVEMRGYVDEAELGDLYSGALAAVFPSLYEGFHLPALDAVSLGCPVIASDIPVHREVLGDAALYCPPNDRDALVAQVRRLAGDAALRQRLVDLGRAQARTFDWARSAATLADVIRSLARQ